jgi:hypothetical protein
VCAPPALADALPARVVRLDEHRNLADVREGRPRSRQASLEVLVDLTRLGSRVGAADDRASAISGHAAGDEDKSPRLDDVGEVADGFRIGAPISRKSRCASHSSR